MRHKLIIFGPYPPPFGGVSIYVSTLFSHLRQQGAKLWAVCSNSSNDPNIKCIRQPHTELSKLLINDGANAKIVDSSAFFMEYPDKLLITLWIALKGILSFYWIKIIHDGTLPSRYRNFTVLQKLFFKISLRAVDEFIVVNEELRTWLKHDIKVNQPVTSIKSLLPLSSNYATPLTTDNTYQFIKRYDKIVCSIGVFIKNYGFKHVAAAVENIRNEKSLNIGLILIDGTFALDSHYKSDVLNNRPWINVVENVPHAQILQILSESHVFVRALASESYGLSRVEALWCGTPVVATRVGETRGMLLFDYGDNTALATQILEALFNPLVKENIRTWADRFQREADDNLDALISTICK